MAKVYVLLVFTFSLLGISGSQEFFFRFRLVDAVMSVTDDDNEQKQLLSLARYETDYRERLAAPRCECKVYECDHGRAKGTWQIIPRTRAEAGTLCVSLEEDARVALSRIRESRHACSRLPENERLALWYRGSCSSEEGKRMSRISAVVRK